LTESQDKNKVSGSDQPVPGPAAQAGEKGEETTEEVREQFRVQMESFEGPLDLLLAVIQKNEMDIFSVSLTRITQDYLDYLNLLQQLDLDVAGDYLVVASTLVLMKSRALLPAQEEEEELEEEDPMMLQQRLEEYRQFQVIADALRDQEYESRDLHFRKVDASREFGEELEFYDLNVYDLFSAFKTILKDIGETEMGVIRDEDWTVDEKMYELNEMLQSSSRANLSGYLRSMRSKLEVIVTFLALLEMIRLHRLVAKQSADHGEIWVMRLDDPAAGGGSE
jgi:segregation and condensation protein A